MPEGDSIYRVAALLRPRLEGALLTDARVRGDALVPGLVGQTVLAVESRGKHLLIRAEQGPSLRVHLGMRGRWRRFPPGSTWRRPRREACLILATAEDVFACFRAKVEVLRGPFPERSRSMIALGPDLLDPDLLARDPELSLILARARADSQRPLHEVLLDQRVAAGIGNVYKSELLFLARLDPLTPVAAVADPELSALYLRAVRLLNANLGPGRRVTRGLEPGEAAPRPGQARHYVYRRAGRACFRCQTPVRFARWGDQARSTYWCPGCQPAFSASCKAGSSL